MFFRVVLEIKKCEIHIKFNTSFMAVGANNPGLYVMDRENKPC
jgi:predicted ATPase with chaperone activity